VLVEDQVEVVAGPLGLLGEQLLVAGAEVRAGRGQRRLGDPLALGRREAVEVRAHPVALGQILRLGVGLGRLADGPGRGRDAHGRSPDASRRTGQGPLLALACLKSL
jgi:hypothetical protein